MYAVECHQRNLERWATKQFPATGRKALRPAGGRSPRVHCARIFCPSLLQPGDYCGRQILQTSGKSLLEAAGHAKTDLPHAQVVLVSLSSNRLRKCRRPASARPRMPLPEMKIKQDEAPAPAKLSEPLPDLDFVTDKSAVPPAAKAPLALSAPR